MAFEHTSTKPSAIHTIKTDNLYLKWTTGDNPDEQTVYIGNRVLTPMQCHKIEMVKAATAFLEAEGYSVYANN